MCMVQVQNHFAKDLASGKIFYSNKNIVRGVIAEIRVDMIPKIMQALPTDCFSESSLESNIAPIINPTNGMKNDAI